MKIDLPQCNFKECRYCSDNNCRDKNRYDSCMYKYYHAAYMKLMKDGNFEDQKYPEILGYYTLLIFVKETHIYLEVSRKWDGKKFVGLNTDLYDIVAWKPHIQSMHK